MSLVSRLDKWRRVFTEDLANGEPPFTEETVLAQFLYSAIDNFLDHELDGLWKDMQGSTGEEISRAIDGRINRWVDTYALDHAVAAAI